MKNTLQILYSIIVFLTIIMVILSLFMIFYVIGYVDGLTLNSIENLEKVVSNNTQTIQEILNLNPNYNNEKLICEVSK